jgi:NAD(P)-dependent dehydrogenase (short-subunit alcohol dehydrogenase family)
MEFLEELSGHVRLGLKSNIKVDIKGATALSPAAALPMTFPTTAVPVVAPVAASAAPPVVAPAVTTKAAIQTITKTVASAYHVYGKKYNVVNVGLRMVRPYDQYLYNPSNDTLINVKQNPGIIPVEASAGGNGAMFVGNYSFLPDIGAALQHARSVQAKIDKYNSRLLKWYEENPNATESEKKRYVEDLRHSYQQWR